ncbi:MAG TPA: GntR family transcriptional regulator [Chthoniobacteraceae bacterium]|nr:GntR family transcriptional regulator [Chthoniobacteraceae bacterium]
MEPTPFPEPYGIGWITGRGGVTLAGMNSSLPQRYQLAAEVTRVLRQALLENRWESHLPSERNLSREFHVSRETIRSSLHELEREGFIVRRNRSRCLIVRREGPVAEPGRRVAMLSAVPFEQWESRILIRTNRLRHDFSKAGIDLVIRSGARFFSAEHHRALEAVVSETNAACWILQGATREVQEWFVVNRVPAIVMGHSFEGTALPSIDIDLRLAVRHATSLFLSRGHRRIALVVREPEYAGDHFAEKGWREAFAAKGDLQPDRDLLSHDGTIPGLQRALDRRFLAREPPTALIAPAKLLLTAVLHLAQRGRIAGRDYAFAARDDDPVLDSMLPTVARYRIDPLRLARRLFLEAMKIVDRSEGPLRRLSLMPEFVTGESASLEMREELG